MINDMLKKGSKIVWNAETKRAFQEIKEAITNTPVLISPNYSKTFFLYSFALDHSIAGVLTHRDDNQDERPIAFMSFPLRDTTLRYSTLEKQAYDLVQSVTKFRHYILRSKVIAVVANFVVKFLLIQHELGEKRGNWLLVFKNMTCRSSQ